MRKYPSAKDLAKLTKPGRYAIGFGAYLQISRSHTRSWVLRIGAAPERCIWALVHVRSSPCRKRVRRRTPLNA
jgi:hypothetical protein